MSTHDHLLRLSVHNSDHYLHENWHRTHLDLSNRKDIWGAQTSSVWLPSAPQVPGYEEYWRFYGGELGVDVFFDENLVSTAKPYIANKPAAMFYGNGMENVYMRHCYPDMTAIHYNDAQIGEETHYPGTIEGELTIRAAGMGYAVCFLGMESSPPTQSVLDIYKAKSKTELYELTIPRAVEFSSKWRQAWNNYAYPTHVVSPLELTPKDEIMLALHREGLLNRVRSCDHYPVDFNTPARWCGNCYECASTAVVAWCTGVRHVLNYHVSQRALTELQYDYVVFFNTGKDIFLSMRLYPYLEEKYSFKLLELTTDVLNKQVKA